MANDEEAAYQVVGRAMHEVAESSPAELLIADSSRAHLRRLALNPAAPPPSCTVDSPFGCVAVRRGRATVFESSEALNACAYLRDRPGGPCSAVCVPVTFMGRSLGVLHTTGPDNQTFDTHHVEKLTTLAAQTGSRIGTVRAFAQSQLQASTDGLTGLMNRRTLENELRSMIQDGRPFALAMADLDKFKLLNDTYGHEGGDRALRFFAHTVRSGIRENDIIARYGGEEFVLVFPDADATHAAELLDRLRVILAGALQATDTAPFTASFGVTDSRCASELDDIVRLADDALMAAKAQGRNRVVVSGVLAH
jgi:diguanylate cyclase (GGDEF)-like protein